MLKDSLNKSLIEIKQYMKECNNEKELINVDVLLNIFINGLCEQIKENPEAFFTFIVNTTPASLGNNNEKDCQVIVRAKQDLELICQFANELLLQENIEIIKHMIYSPMEYEDIGNGIIEQ